MSSPMHSLSHACIPMHSTMRVQLWATLMFDSTIQVESVAQRVWLCAPGSVCESCLGAGRT